MEHGEFLEGVEAPAPHALCLDDWSYDPAELHFVGNAVLHDQPISQAPAWQRLRRAHLMSHVLSLHVDKLVGTIAVWDAHLARTGRPGRTVALTDWSRGSAGPDLPLDPDDREVGVTGRGASRAFHAQALALIGARCDLGRVLDEIVAGRRPPDGPELDRLAEQMARTWQVREELAAWFR